MGLPYGMSAFDVYGGAGFGNVSALQKEKVKGYKAPRTHNSNFGNVRIGVRSGTKNGPRNLVTGSGDLMVHQNLKG